MRDHVAVVLVCPWCKQREDVDLELSVTSYGRRNSFGHTPPWTMIAVSPKSRSRVIWTHECPGPERTT